jgi:hypothetical protein
MIKNFNRFINESDKPTKEKKQPNLVFYGHKQKSKQNGQDYYNDIYSSSFGTKMCGDGEIYELTFSISEDKDIDKDYIEYWGWKTDDNRISMIFPKYFLFDMCFPSGAKKAEELEEGERVKLILTGSKVFHEKKIEEDERKKRKY